MFTPPQRSPWRILADVVSALIVRELRTRFGPYRLGLAWVLLEPAAHVAVLAAIFGARRAGSLHHDEFILYLVTGIVPWLFFSNYTQRALTAIEANQGLFAYRQVRPIDPLVARMIVEGTTALAVLTILLFGLSLCGFEVGVADPLGLAAALGLLAVFSFGVGLLFMVAGHLVQESNKLLPIAIRPLYFFSGIFYSVASLPAAAQQPLLANPITHFMELIRLGFFAHYPCRGSWAYVGLATLLVYASGAAIYLRHSNRLRVAA